MGHYRPIGPPFFVRYHKKGARQPRSALAFVSFVQFAVLKKAASAQIRLIREPLARRSQIRVLKRNADACAAPNC